MRWFNNLDSTTRAFLITIVNAAMLALWTVLGQPSPPPTFINPTPAVVNVMPAPGVPMTTTTAK